MEQMQSVSGRRRVRHRRSRRGVALPSCPMELNSDSGENFSKSGSLADHVTAATGAEQFLSQKVSTRVSSPPSHVIQALLDSPERCRDVITSLSRADQAEQHEILMQLQNGLCQLALTKDGCRIIQKLFEVTGGVDRDLIVFGLQEHIVELYESPHGNFVLSKAIEVLPAAKNSFIISALLGRGISVCKHRFGCRVVCRLIEHCTEDHIGPLLDEILVDIVMLAQDDYGNYVVQVALEHASEGRKSLMEAQLLPGFASLAMHKDGSRVAERLLESCSSRGQKLAVHTLLKAEGGISLVEVACSRYGSYVIARLAGLRQTHIEMSEVASILASNLQSLQESEYAERVITAFGLIPAQ